MFIKLNTFNLQQSALLLYFLSKKSSFLLKTWQFNHHNPKAWCLMQGEKIPIIGWKHDSSSTTIMTLSLSPDEAEVDFKVDTGMVSSKSLPSSSPPPSRVGGGHWWARWTSWSTRDKSVCYISSLKNTGNDVSHQISHASVRLNPCH
jgi:hypothetical protein